MLIAYDIPIDWTYSVSGGTLVTDGDAMCDHSPASYSRITWPTGDQTTGTTCVISAARSTAFVPRVGYLLGLRGVGAGQKVEIKGKRAEDSGYTYALGGNALTQKTVEFADGSIGCWWVFDADLDEIVGWAVTAYNDFGGSVLLAAEDAIDVGECNVAPAAEIDHYRNWTIRRNDPSVRKRTLRNQARRVKRTANRVLTIVPDMAESSTYGAAATDTVTLDRLCASLAAEPFGAVVIDPDDQHTAIFGELTIGEVEKLDGAAYQLGRIEVEEIPA